MKKIIYIILAMPSFAFAGNTDLDEVFEYFLGFLEVASDLLISLAMVWFFWALIKFIWISREGKEDVEKHKDMLIWSSIALFMMVGIWSIVGYVQSSVGVDLSESKIDYTPVMPDRIY